jgi:hypothetical protein
VVQLLGGGWQHHGLAVLLGGGRQHHGLAVFLLGGSWRGGGWEPQRWWSGGFPWQLLPCAGSIVLPLERPGGTSWAGQPAR